MAHFNLTHRNNTKAKASPKPTRAPSFTVVDLNSHHSFDIDQTTLVHIVKEKDLESLEKLGGVEGVATALQTHIEYGIKGGDDDAAATEDITRRKQVFGSNTYNKPPPKGFFHFVVEAFKDVQILILLACVALSLVSGIMQYGLEKGSSDGVVILLMGFFAIFMSSMGDSIQIIQFDKLSQVSNHIQIDAVRNGRPQHVPLFEIVVGDVICLKIGDQVPADGLFIEGHSLKVDELSMTGESDHDEISRHHHPFLFSGTKVADGYAKMLVTSVGMNTTWGQMMSSISSDIDEETPLQERLNKLTSSIRKVGLAVASLILVVFLVRYFTGNTKNDKGVTEFNGSKTKFYDIINAVEGIVGYAITIVVVANPESLQLAATLTLAYSMKKMMDDHAMVRKLSACQSMGSATTICTDKTGTLALNHMKVTKFWLGLEPVAEIGSVYSMVAPSVLQLIQEGVALNTTGSVHRSDKYGFDFEFSGSPTEKAILSWAVLELNMEMECLTRSCSIIHVDTFNSKKKRSGILLRRKVDSTVNAHWKGAAEVVLKMCSRYYDASGIAKDLDNDSMKKFEHIIQGTEASSLRCIAFAHVEVAEEELADEEGNASVKVKENGLTLLGLVGIKDPCKINGSKIKFGHRAIAAVVIWVDLIPIFLGAISESLSYSFQVNMLLILVSSIKKMIANQAMVRKLFAHETMGSATTICTDKTGTLTHNQMKVTKFSLGLEPVAEITSVYSKVAPFVLQLIHEGVALNTTGSVHRSDKSGSEFEFSGSPTEKAILSWAVLELNMEMERLTRSCSIIHVETFNSKNKRSGVLLRRKVDSTVNAHWKGAAEVVLKMCSRYYDASGIAKDLDYDSMKKFEHIIQGMAASSLLCIAFAHVEVAEEEIADEEGNISVKVKENGLTLLGLVGIKVPCRPGVKAAVEACQHAGVNVKMITEDNVFTAKAIATECGILQPNQDTDGAVVEGEEFRNYTPEERMEKVDKICVMARSSPFDKLLMVQCLKEKGHVVAVTGDGTNDARALKEANIGLSMGIQGTEVAKVSSNIVLLDDNFASIVTVLRWGRCVYNNIQKFIQFQLTVSMTVLAINFVAAVSAGEVPLTAVQLFWVNIIVASGALALATEKPTAELMDKPPVDRTKPLITNVMWRNLLAQALYQIAILLTLKFKGESIFGVTSDVNYTLIFNTFVLCQVFNAFNARKMEKRNVFKGIHRSKWFLVIIGFAIILQVVTVEFLKHFFHTKRLNWGQWGICIALAAISWPIGWLVKLIPVPDKPLLNFLVRRNEDNQVARLVS